MLQLLKGSYKADDLYFLQNLLENGLDFMCSIRNPDAGISCHLCRYRNVCASVQRLANYAGQIADSMMKESSK